MCFPKYFPVQCPPADCSDTLGTFYRIIGADKPAKRDFVPYWLLYPHKQRMWIKKGEACRACGLSVFAAIGEARKLKQKIPSLREGKIALGTLKVGMGKVKATPRDSSHHTWWVPNTIKDPSVFFKVVA